MLPSIISVVAGIYLTCTMAITTLSMVLTVLVLNLHSISERPVPRWIRVLVLEYLAKLFCRCDDHTSIQREQDTTPNHTRKKKRKVLHHSNPMHNSTRGIAETDDTDTEQVPIIALNGDGRVGFNNSGNTGMETTSFVLLSSQERNHNIHKAPHQHNEVLLQDGEKKPDYSKDWQRLAEIVDRLFFWAFLLAIIAISLLLFHPLTKEYIYPTEDGTVL